MRRRGGYVYILASRRRGTLYIGVTSSIARRVWQHRQGEGSRFAARYGVHRLVWAERFDDIRDAIAQEKCLKKWRRAWKLDLIEISNPNWNDLLADVPPGV